MNKTVKFALLILLIVVALFVVPAVFVWTINSLAKSGGSDFYLNHSLWNYFLCLLLIGILRGGKG